MITWSETKFHHGNAYIESIDPRGYTVISIVIPGVPDGRKFCASYDGKEKLPPFVCMIEALDPWDRKDAAKSAKEACEKHYEAALAPPEDAQSLGA